MDKMFFMDYIYIEMHTIIFNRKLVYGTNTFEQTGTIAKDYGQKALIVTGQQSTKKTGVLFKLEKILQTNGIEYIIFDKAKPNPTVDIIDEGAEIGRTNNCNLIIGLGGGSALDTAKAISGMITNEGSVEEYLEFRKEHKIMTNQPLPMIAIPTTAGTGSEATKNAVINSPGLKIKRSIRDDRLVPEVAILDPVLISTAPKDVLAASAMDALTQLIEPFTGKKAQPVIDIIAMDGIKRIGKNLIQFIENPSNHKAGLELLIASYFSGIALANAGLGAVHALSRPFGGLYNLPHGLICAILLPYITEQNWYYNIKKYAQIAKALGIEENLSEEKLASKVYEKIFDMNNLLGIPSDFRRFNIPKKDIEKIIEDAQGGSMRNNPKDFSKEELKELLLKIL